MVKKTDLWMVTQERWGPHAYDYNSIEARSIVDPAHKIQVYELPHQKGTYGWNHSYLSEDEEVPSIQSSEGYFSPEEAFEAATRIIVIPKWKSEYQRIMKESGPVFVHGYARKGPTGKVVRVGVHNRRHPAKSDLRKFMRKYERSTGVKR
jgi:hypothetical protein